ncbi:glycosyltransferase [Methylotenera sp.]|uniref:glycosyltransferase n=1 Tax=Methylotenera sp. TaxID=2051956 RepID=UPI0024879008|nr:glycosyltransferase [Methylotenera sp.]MDI1299680.1 glycosyltransferase [Methylotenera sp.]
MLINQRRPTVAVLMATYNGSPWINDQIDSILNQTSVDITVYVSDDMSEDATYTYLLDRAEVSSQLIILPQKERYGSAGKNFYRLIKDVNTTDFDYIAFADQDDIWDQHKLIRHIKLMQDNNVCAVSSNVIAFWPDGKTKLIDKSQPQRELDFLFESAGPGCTFLMTSWLVSEVKKLLIDSSSVASQVALHDWLVYAVCRASGKKWLIDSKPSLHYRQHDKNVVGANSGLKAMLSRLRKVSNGWYRREVLKVLAVSYQLSNNPKLLNISSLLEKSDVVSRIKLLRFIPQARRKMTDCLFLALMIIFGLF